MLIARGKERGQGPSINLRRKTEYIVHTCWMLIARTIFKYLRRGDRDPQKLKHLEKEYLLAARGKERGRDPLVILIRRTDYLLDAI